MRRYCTSLDSCSLLPGLVTVRNGTGNTVYRAAHYMLPCAPVLAYPRPALDPAFHQSPAYNDDKSGFQYIPGGALSQALHTPH